MLPRSLTERMLGRSVGNQEEIPMDMAQLENDIERAVGAEPLAPRVNGKAPAMPLDQLEKGIHDALEMRARFKDHLRHCAALIIEIERAL